MFHQVHLPVASFPNDPDENIIVHLSSRLFITRPKKLTLHDIPGKINRGISLYILIVKKRKTYEICVENFVAFLVPASGIQKTEEISSSLVVRHLATGSLLPTTGGRSTTQKSLIWPQRPLLSGYRVAAISHFTMGVFFLLPVELLEIRFILVLNIGPAFESKLFAR